MSMDKPAISIICNAFNQEKYIADALESFLMQEVSVPFEILIHDDASTDNTAGIIKKYAEKYPNIIKPILQTENQYSEGTSITYEIQMPRAEGKYIAFCEGDDYWTDFRKLQIQYDYMEEHAECSACCHAYSMVDSDKNLLEERFDFDYDCNIPFIKLLGNQLKLPQFASWFVRRENFNGFSGKFLDKFCNDMVMRIYCSTLGELHYFNRNMSCYRRFTENSWTMRVGQSKKNMAKQIIGYIPFLESLNDYTGGIHEEDIAEAIDDRKFEAFILEDNYREAHKCKTFKKQSPVKKIYIYIGCAVPWLIKVIKNIKDRIK